MNLKYLNKFALVLLASFFTFITFESCKTLDGNNYSKNDVLNRNYLTAYGEHVFERESCTTCHTLNIDKKDASKISLDGLGNKYSSDWLYYFLSDPKKFMMQPKMPTHVHLHDKLIDKPTFEKIVAENGSRRQNRKLDKVWNKLLTQADDLSKDIPNKDPKDTRKTEVLALISYLQQIPSSPAKITADSMILAKHLEKEKLWKDFVLDENSVTLQVSKKPESIEKGKELFQSKCAPCHGFKGEGGSGPNLTDEYWFNGGSDLEIAKTIIYGVVEKGMMSFHYQVNPTEAGELLAYIKSIKNKTH